MIEKFLDLSSVKGKKVRWLKIALELILAGYEPRQAYKLVYKDKDAFSSWYNTYKNLINATISIRNQLKDAKTQEDTTTIPNVNISWDWVIQFCYSKLKEQASDDKSTIEYLNILVKALEKKSKLDDDNIIDV